MQVLPMKIFTKDLDFYRKMLKTFDYPGENITLSKVTPIYCVFPASGHKRAEVGIYIV